MRVSGQTVAPPLTSQSSLKRDSNAHASHSMRLFGVLRPPWRDSWLRLCAALPRSVFAKEMQAQPLDKASLSNEWHRRGTLFRRGSAAS